MAWWAWAVVGWCLASLAAALVLGMTSAEISRRERSDRATRMSGLSATDRAVLADPSVLVRLRPDTGVTGLRMRRYVPRSRPGAGGPPPRPVHSRVRSSRPAASLRRHRLARRPGGATPPAARPGREGHVGRPLSQHRETIRSLPAADELALGRRRRAIPSLDCPAVLVVVAPSRRRVRTPPSSARPRLQRLGAPRVRRTLLLSCVPVLALAPLLASSTSSLGKSTALAAELAAHPEQADQLIAALDRGRVMAGLTTPVTAPGAPTPPPAAAPSDDEPAGTSPTPSTGTSAPTTPSGSSGPSAPATTGEATRSTAPQPTTGPTRPEAPATSAPSTPLPPSQGGQVVPVPSTPAVPEPTPTSIPTPSPTPTPTPSPVEPTPTPMPSPVEPTPTPTPTPTPAEPTPTDPAPTDPVPGEPEPIEPAPVAGADGDGAEPTGPALGGG